MPAGPVPMIVVTLTGAPGFSFVPITHGLGAYGITPPPPPPPPPPSPGPPLFVPTSSFGAGGGAGSGRTIWSEPWVYDELVARVDKTKDVQVVVTQDGSIRLLEEDVDRVRIEVDRIDALTGEVLARRKVLEAELDRVRALEVERAGLVQGAEVVEARAEVVVEPGGAVAESDYAVMPLSDVAEVRAMADGVVEFSESDKGPVARLVADDGTVYYYAKTRAGGWRVKRGDVIGFTGGQAAPGLGARLPELPAAAGGAVPPAHVTGDEPAFGILPLPRGGVGDAPAPVPLPPPPPPPASPWSVLLFVGVLGIAAVIAQAVQPKPPALPPPPPQKKKRRKRSRPPKKASAPKKRRRRAT